MIGDSSVLQGLSCRSLAGSSSKSGPGWVIPWGTPECHHVCDQRAPRARRRRTRQAFGGGKSLADSSSPGVRDEGRAEEASKLFEKERNSSASSGAQRAPGGHHQTCCPPVPRRSECCCRRRPHRSLAVPSALQTGHGERHPLSWKVLPI